MKKLLGILQLAGLVSCCFASDIYFTSIPSSMKLSKNQDPINVADVSHVINYMMGLSTQKARTWNGIEHLDIFNRPKANLFINVHVPALSDISIKQFEAKIKTQESEGMAPTLEETNAAIYYSSTDRKPLIVDFERDQTVFNTLAHNSGLFNDLAATFTEIKQRLEKPNSVAGMLSPTSCLRTSQEDDVLFLGELQIMQDILSRLTSNAENIVDEIPDSYYFTVSGVDMLVKKYGTTSCQVKEALQLLEQFLAEYTRSFNDLYKGQLLAEVNVIAEVKREFFQIRRSRSLMATNETTVLGGYVEPTMPDFAIYINIAVWTLVVIALATLASSYFIWFMDPGRDSIIYRMTTQRMKLD